MKITKSETEKNIVVAVDGRVDTTTASELAAELNSAAAKTQQIVLDCEKLIYISSAGLRVLLSAHKGMNKKGGYFVIKNVSTDVREIFDITGFSKILIFA